MRGVRADCARRAPAQSGKRSAFGAMPVNDVRRGLRDPRRDGTQGAKVGVIELPADGEPAHTEREFRGEFGKRGIGARATGQSVGNESHAMSKLGLAAGYIEHVPEKTADRCAQDVQDVERRVRRRATIATDRCAGSAGFIRRRLNLDSGAPVGHRSIP